MAAFMPMQAFPRCKRVHARKQELGDGLLQGQKGLVPTKGGGKRMQCGCGWCGGVHAGASKSVTDAGETLGRRGSERTAHRQGQGNGPGGGVGGGEGGAGVAAGAGRAEARRGARRTHAPLTAKFCGRGQGRAGPGRSGAAQQAGGLLRRLRQGQRALGSAVRATPAWHGRRTDGWWAVQRAGAQWRMRLGTNRSW